MSNKKDIRKIFKQEVFKRDGYSCLLCGHPYTKEIADASLDAHHILDRNSPEFEGTGGYVKENGISLCKDPMFDSQSCHMKAEKFHITGGAEWEPGVHPNDLYKLISSSKEEAIKASKKLC